MDIYVSLVNDILLVNGFITTINQPQRPGPTSFRHLLQRLHVRPLGRASLLVQHSVHPFRCGACGTRAPRLYLCVSCDAVACETHAPDHEHNIAIDVDRAELYCCACGDQVYDRDFNSAVVLSQTAAATLGGCSSLCSPPPKSLRKRRRVEFRPWAPDSKERALLGLGLQSSDSDIPIGLRGLNNLGNTCFMNSVLQALYQVQQTKWKRSKRESRDGGLKKP